MVASSPPSSIDALTAVDATSLGRLSLDDLGELFGHLPAPPARLLGGELRGELVSLAGVSALPGAVRAPLLAALRLGARVWRGKGFYGEDGSNLWPLGLRFAHYRVREGLGQAGAGRVIQLDYAVPTNLAPLRPILGEVKALGPGLFLGRMHYRVGGRLPTLLYFTLEA